MEIAIFANGEIKDYSIIKAQIKSAKYIICCDGGARHTIYLDVVPDMLVGDFDSISSDALEFYKNKKVEIKTFPKEKDFTDLDIAIDLAIKKEASLIKIIAGMGGRLDHELTNIGLLLKGIRNNISIKFLDGNSEIMLIDKNVSLKGSVGDLISLIPYSAKVYGISTDGLYYKLDEEDLNLGESRGNSNYFLGPSASINLKKGLLIVIHNKN